MAAAGSSASGMSTASGADDGIVAAIGEPLALQGFALAGVAVLTASTAEQARARWAGLGRDVALVLLTRPAADALGDLATTVRGPLVATLPE
jgi:vacuolar-type H+-ATPase subunit F/Vma7